MHMMLINARLGDGCASAHAATIHPHWRRHQLTLLKPETVSEMLGMNCADPDRPITDAHSGGAVWYGHAHPAADMWVCLGSWL